MEKVLQSIIALLGLCVISSNVQRKYYFVYEPKTFSEALSYCREKYTDLVSVENEEEMRLLNSMADLSKMVSAENSNQAWIGMTFDSNSWRWSLSDSTFYKPGEAEFRIWNNQEPNEPYTQLCVILYYNHLWNSDFCSEIYPAVCCNVTGSDVAFVYIPTAMTWTEAQSYCRKHHTDLASVRNMAEQKNLEEMLPKDIRIWIGLSKELCRWSDGSQSSFRYWKNNTGNNITEGCAAADFRNSGKWEKSNCDSKRASICYTAISGSRKMVKVKLMRSKSSLDLNDPVVMKDILIQLKQNLKDQGLNENIRLSWRKQADGNIFHGEEEEEQEGDEKKDC